MNGWTSMRQLKLLLLDFLFLSDNNQCPLDFFISCLKRKTYVAI